VSLFTFAFELRCFQCVCFSVGALVCSLHRKLQCELHCALALRSSERRPAERTANGAQNGCTDRLERAPNGLVVLPAAHCT